MAAATAPGRGAIAIVRLSGPLVPAMLPQLLSTVPQARVASTTSFYDAERRPLDRGLALYFPAPHSYTGEHLLELHGHGGPVLTEALIRRVLALGARRAEPGEFTLRAYLNGKLDLAQAEAVASLIDAASDEAARAALRSLDGEFSRRVHSLSEALAQLRVHVEAAIDFAEEEVGSLTMSALQTRLTGVMTELAALRAASRQGRMLAEGMQIVITGRPNVGKSTLLNRLAGYDAAIVTEVAGTTRDVLRESIVLDGLPVQLLDTAGLRSAGESPGDAIEAEGIRRAESALTSADHILFVIDIPADPEARAFMEERSRLPSGVPVTLVLNKLDSLGPPGSESTLVSKIRHRMPESNPDGSIEKQTPSISAEAAPPRPGVVALSALTGAGMGELIGHLKERAGLSGPDAGLLSARARHVEALERVAAHLSAADGLMSSGRAPELIAEELSRAQRALAEIVHVDDSEELLGRIFASFCIGK